ncbi:nucleotidyltransferase family protein [Azoarcus sp. PA01]|nr:nucleotidyltransferase family protein [Azoarcus sp. PA01]
MTGPASPVTDSADVALLLIGVRTPLAIDEMRWERLLRIGRVAGLHGRLATANLANPELPPPVRRHLLSSARVAAFRCQMLRAELFHLARLCSNDFPVILLKGSAYVLQRRRMAEGRFVSDVDLLVPREQLRIMEDRLKAAGWQAQKLDAYDERYYRDWSHETPPLRYPGRTLEVDLHHAITPVTGRRAFDPATLFDRSEPIPGTPFHALCAEDQVLHASLHCFNDGDLELRVREVVDIDGLIREYADRPGFWDRLGQRATELGLERPLWYGLHYARQWLACPVPVSATAELKQPPALHRRLMDMLVPLAMLPPSPDHPPGLKVKCARVLMLARHHLLRMPPHMLAPHLTRKSLRRMRAHFGGNPEAGSA